MKFRFPLHFGLFFAALLFCAASASAQTTSDSKDITMDAEVVTSVTLDISHDSFDFGTVDGLGTNDPADASITKELDGTGGTLYYKTEAITVTPHYSGFASPSVTMTVEGSGADKGMLREGSAVAGLKSETVNSSRAVTTSGNGAGVSRYIGLYVARSEAAKSSIDAKLTYLVSVE